MNQQIKVSLPGTLADALRKVARYSATSQSALIRLAVLQWLRHHKAPEGLLTDEEVKSIRCR